MNLKKVLSYSLLNTLYLNFKVFPFKIAIKLPIKVGNRVIFQNLHKGCIQLTGEIKRFTITIGISSGGSMYAEQGAYTLIRFSGKGKMKLGNNIRIYSGCSLIVAHNGLIALGNNILVNQRTLIHSSKRVLLGDNVRIGWNCQIYDSNFHFIYDEKSSETIKSPYKDIILGNNVWIANSCTIAKGTIIPSFSILASNSLANRDYSSFGSAKGNLFAGAPATFIRSGVFRIVNTNIEKMLFRYFNNPDKKIYSIEEDIDKNDFYKV